jgi:5-methylcytosine-specific restriction endonuclease McrA
MKRKAREWAIQNKERLRKIKSDWSKKNRDRLTESHRQYSKENKAALMEKRRAYMKKEGPRLAKVATDSARRVKKMGSSGTADLKSVRQFMSSATSCFYCKRAGLKLTLDHFISLAKGGAHSLENFRAACRSCNSRKKDRDPHAFLMEITLELTEPTEGK